GEAAGGDLAANDDGGVRGGVDGGVLDQFGHQVDHVADHRAGEALGRHRLDDHPLVVLDLGGGAAGHVQHRHRLAPAAPGGGARQDDQALGVAAHPGGQVVQPEQVVQVVRVGGAVLHAL